MVDIRDAQPEPADKAAVVDLTADIVSAYVSHNNISPAQLPELIANVSSALQGQLSGPAKPEPEPQKPAVPIRKSVQPDEITCVECGKKFKSLRRHIRVEHGLDPNEYRQKWGLPRDYPMTAPNYAEKRSALAKSLGLGRKPSAAAPAPKGRGKRGAKAKAEAPEG
ncbi:MAG TPA: MucR family transcriptional regulator [Afifellaceae bacterium]|nr:MucR family transcriptional regulator [Afifellaceae bacterium]